MNFVVVKWLWKVEPMRKDKIRGAKENLLNYIRDGKDLSRGQRISLVVALSLPTIFAQIASIIMQYIDAAMVGRIGADNAAAIGLIASTTWLFGGLCSAAAIGFAVQVAQYLGAKKEQEAGEVLRTALISVLIFSVAIAVIGISISWILPVILGGEQDIQLRATYYFLIFACSLPIRGMNALSTGMLQSTGNMKVPSILNILMCFLDVVFNAFLIFDSLDLHIAGIMIRIHGAGLGVIGAAAGTTMAEFVTASIMLYILCYRTPIFKKHLRNKTKINLLYLKKAAKISSPVAFENTVMTGAMIVSTRIVAPLGNVALAAHSFAITAESLCYMPGYGIGKAATTLVGQSIGAGRKALSKLLAKTTVYFGMAVMTVSGAIMFIAAPWMISFLSPDPQVQALATFILRIEAFAEPLYAASIVASGALQGEGDTLIPSIMNFASMWFVRIPLSIFLAMDFGLVGVWIAMAFELCFRGIILLMRLFRRR